MKSDIFKIALFLLSFLFFSCSVDIPQEYKDLGDEQLEIYPDYKNVTVPCNVAPLNFMVKETIGECVVTLKTPSSRLPSRSKYLSIHLLKRIFYHLHPP